MNRESKTSTFDPASDGPRRSRRRPGGRPRRAVVVSGAVALMAVVGGGYGVAKTMGGTSGDNGRDAEAASARAAAGRTPEGPAEPSAAYAPAAPSATPRDASPSASTNKDASGKTSGSDRSAKTDAGSGKAAGGDAGSGAKAERGAMSGATSGATSETGSKPALAAGKTGGKAPTGTKKNGSHVQQVVDMVNAERARHGCSPVTVNAKLQAAAQGHSDDMAARDYYAHTSPDGRGPGDRISAAGYRWSTYGENIFKSPKDARTAMDGWMKSPGHRANILNCAFKEMGVGVNFSSNGPWWTQNFAASS